MSDNEIPRRPRSIKVIKAPSADYLVERVNHFLGTHMAKDYEFLGKPEVWGHEEYVQFFIDYGNEVY